MNREGIPQFKTLEEEKAYWESKGSFGIEAQREEIREGVVEIFNRWANGFDPLFSKEKRVEKIFEYLHSRGVVIKVECPTCHGIGVFGRGEPVEVKCGMCNGAGYSAVESLI